MSVYSDFAFFSENGVLTGRSFVRTDADENKFIRFFWTPQGEIEIEQYDQNNVAVGAELRYDTAMDTVIGLGWQPPFEVGEPISLGDGNNARTFGSGDDIIYGEGGNDIINAGSGDNIVYGGAGNDTFAFTGFHSPMHYIQDFHDGDVINVSDVLNGYDPLTDDINDFVQVNHISSTRTDLRINDDGIGGGFTSLVGVFANLQGMTVNDLIDSGRLVADHKLFASDG